MTLAALAAATALTLTACGGNDNGGDSSRGGDTVRIGIKAPSDVDIHREEIYRDLQQANEAAATARPGAAAALSKRLRKGAGDAGTSRQKDRSTPTDPPSEE